MVDVVRGALGPELERAVKKQLAQEHLVLEGKAERKPVRKLNGRGMNIILTHTNRYKAVLTHHNAILFVNRL